MAKVSVIIPAYNVENYLLECMESIVNQTLTDLEIICINDGSTDATGQILSEYEKKDARIKVVNLQNSGQGIARNYGIDLATGDYLAFVDSDDWLELDMCENLYNNAKRFNSDIVESPWYKFNENYNKTRLCKCGCILPVNKSFNYTFNRKYLFSYTFAAWNKLYRTDFVKSNNIKFANAKLMEDNIFVFKNRVLAKNISYCNRPLYHYRVRAGSSINNISTETMKVVPLLREVKEFLESSNILNKYEDSFNNYVINIANWNWAVTPEDLKVEYDKQCREFFSDRQYENYEKLKKNNDKPLEKIFSIKNVYQKCIMYKIIKIFGLKIKYYIKKKHFNGPIDLVYLWCNSSDENWNNKRINTLKSLNKTFNENAVNACRFQDNDELKISLRSVEKYVPWINRIFIVTDNQVPEWLDLNNPKVEIVDHKDIIPKEYLPCFNSNVIESFIYRIQGLSEHFIYANDDEYYNFPVTKDFFFDTKGRPIVRLNKMPSSQTVNSNFYLQTVTRMQNLIKKKFNKKICLEPHHNVDAYTISICNECEKVFSKEYEISRENKFRESNDVQRSLVLYWAIANKRAVLKRLHNVDIELPFYTRILNILTRKYQRDSKCFGVHRQNIRDMISLVNPKLFCINDNEISTDNDRQNVKHLLYSMFPEKSAFEK